MLTFYDKLALWFFGLVTVAVVLLILGHGVHELGYERGQIDALNNQWLYQRVTTADGATSYVHLTKATTRPAEAR